MIKSTKAITLLTLIAVLFGGLGACDDKKEGDKGQTATPAERHGEIQLTKAQIELAEIKVAPARVGTLDILISVPGEVSFDQDRLTHVLARAAGFVHDVRASAGDSVRAGDIMALIESRELSEAKAAYLAARERAALAQEKFAREDRLWRQKVSAEQEYLESRRVLVEAQIELRSSEQALRALGFNDNYIGDLSRGVGLASTRYELAAPIDGTVTERNIVRGQKVDSEVKAFIVADLARVWVIASVYERDIGRVRSGQKASVSIRGLSAQPFMGIVARVGDVIDERSRTLKIRVDIDNSERTLKPGMFARVDLAVDSKIDALAVPTSAVLTQKDESFVFVDEGEGRFSRREIKIGSRSFDTVEVIEGLNPDENVVVQGASTLKAELNKESLGEAGHGH